MKANQNVNGVFRWAGVESAWQLAEEAARSARTCFFSGPPGVGKSHVALAAGKPTFQITLSEDITVHDLQGHFVPDGAQFRWHDGPAMRAMKLGGVLVLNEVHRASGAVQDFLLGVLDSPTVASIALPGGEIVSPAAGFRVIATSNSSPDTLDPALRSRFEIEVQLTEPNPAIISHLNQALDGLGDALRDSFKDSGREMDPRKTMKFAALIKSGTHARKAALLTFGERAPDIVAALSARGVRTS